MENPLTIVIDTKAKAHQYANIEGVDGDFTVEKGITSDITLSTER